MDEYKVFSIEPANRDLEEIYSYISNQINSLKIAEKVIMDILIAEDSLSVFPFRNQIMNCDTARKYELRSELVGNYYIIYTIEKDIVKIIAIMYAKSNIETKLSEDDFRIERLIFSSPK